MIQMDVISRVAKETGVEKHKIQCIYMAIVSEISNQLSDDGNVAQAKDEKLSYDSLITRISNGAKMDKGEVDAIYKTICTEIMSDISSGTMVANEPSESKVSEDREQMIQKIQQRFDNTK